VPVEEDEELEEEPGENETVTIKPTLKIIDIYLVVSRINISAPYVASMEAKLLSGVIVLKFSHWDLKRLSIIIIQAPFIYPYIRQMIRVIQIQKDANSLNCELWQGTV